MHDKDPLIGGQPQSWWRYRRIMTFLQLVVVIAVAVLLLSMLFSYINRTNFIRTSAPDSVSSVSYSSQAV